MKRKIGAIISADNICEFIVWAPFAKHVKVKIFSPDEQEVPLRKDEYGYWKTKVEGIKEGTLYYYKIDDKIERPDPASLSQPEGVHGLSEVVRLDDFNWTDENWPGLPLKDLIIYELHVGTFTEKRTFDGIVDKLPYLKDLGINAIEIMPVAQFPGLRNWGYDGVYPFAVQKSYGGIKGLQNLVNECHHQGIAIILDVVYNHMGPEGNYLSDFGPYFTGKYKTPWGKAINFDDAYSDEVRNYFIQNALMWLKDFHIDGLRLDAIHAIKDLGAHHFLKELSQEVNKLSDNLGIKKLLIGECDLNDSRYLDPYETGGYQLDGQWIDEFHHAVHALVTGEKKGYYEDFGDIDHLTRALRDTYVYNGRYSLHRKKTFGNDVSHTKTDQFVVFAQNHDQVGNRLKGDRLSHLVSFEALKLAAGTVFISPYVPLIFMGEEYAEDNPFLYFVSHTDPDLVEAVRKGRKREFKSFHLEGEMSDPQSEDTLKQSSLQWNYEDNKKQKTILKFYRTLIDLHKNHPGFESSDRESYKVWNDDLRNFIIIHRKSVTKSVIAFLNYSNEKIRKEVDFLEGDYIKILDSSDQDWLGPGSISLDMLKNGIFEINPESIVIYEQR